MPQPAHAGVGLLLLSQLTSHSPWLAGGFLALSQPSGFPEILGPSGRSTNGMSLDAGPRPPTPTKEPGVRDIQVQVTNSYWSQMPQTLLNKTANLQKTKRLLQAVTLHFFPAAILSFPCSKVPYPSHISQPHTRLIRCLSLLFRKYLSPTHTI